VLPFFYRKYPAVKEAIRRRNALYNEQVSLIEELEAKGELIVLRPERPIEVDRMEKDIKKLTALYDEGYELASQIDFI
jgi:predicted patatin/cPLA2 family phospholipase